MQFSQSLWYLHYQPFSSCSSGYTCSTVNTDTVAQSILLNSLLILLHIFLLNLYGQFITGVYEQFDSDQRENDWNFIRFVHLHQFTCLSPAHVCLFNVVSNHSHQTTAPILPPPPSLFVICVCATSLLFGGLSCYVVLYIFKDLIPNKTILFSPMCVNKNYSLSPSLAWTALTGFF